MFDQSKEKKTTTQDTTHSEFELYNAWVKWFNWFQMFYACGSLVFGMTNLSYQKFNGMNYFRGNDKVYHDDIQAKYIPINRTSNWCHCVLPTLFFSPIAITSIIIFILWQIIFLGGIFSWILIKFWIEKIGHIWKKKNICAKFANVFLVEQMLSVFKSEIIAIAWSTHSNLLSRLNSANMVIFCIQFTAYQLIWSLFSLAHSHTNIPSVS